MAKTHYKKMRDPNFIGSWDLLDQDGNVIDRIVTISKVDKQMVFDGNGGKAECPVIHFKETKPMVANSTNLKAIARACASEFIEDWTGKQIKLTVKKVKAFGEVHDAIRVVEGLSLSKKQVKSLLDAKKKLLSTDELSRANAVIDDNRTKDFAKLYSFLESKK